jgi:hypothetical protein
MTMSFPYVLQRCNQPVLTLGGRWVRPRPLIGVTIVGPTDSRFRAGLLDTGADDTVFPERLAAVIGVDLVNAPLTQAASVTHGAIPVRLAQVRLRVTDGSEFREWPALVGFTPAPIRNALLGFAGFLQFLTSTFHGDRELVDLTVNTLCPGT